MTAIQAQRDFMVRFSELITLGIHVGLSRDHGIDIIMDVIASRVDLNHDANWFHGERGTAIMDEIERRFLECRTTNCIH